MFSKTVNGRWEFMDPISMSNRFLFTLIFRSLFDPSESRPFFQFHESEANMDEILNSMVIEINQTESNTNKVSFKDVIRTETEQCNKGICDTQRGCKCFSGWHGESCEQNDSTGEFKEPPNSFNRISIYS